MKTLRIVALPFLLLCASLAPREATAQPAVRYEADIKPILQQHCWKCHGEKRAAGGLRLDERRFAERGGGSGKNLLELAADRNELLRRVRSTMDGERMPSDGPPLPIEKIEALQQWIAQGAEWPVKIETPEWELPPPPTWEIWLDRFTYATSGRYLPAYFLAMAILISMIFVERAKQERLQEKGAKSVLPKVIRKRLARLSRAWYLVAFSGVAIFVLVQFSREQLAEVRQVKKNAAQVHKSRPANGQSVRTEDGQIKPPDLLRPMHPPRLGGLYYRGNDERSTELYNGGFYRTATFEVQLADGEGRALAWGDAVPDEPHLRFVLERSPHSSPSLFIPSIMDTSGLSPVQPEQMATAETVPFFPLLADIPGERWSVLLPLEPIPPQGKLTGKVYLYKGLAGDETNRKGEASYLIGYELSASEGCIAREAQIWMGSVYNLPQLLYPEQGQIPAEHWFDFRPIPEIEN